MDCPYKTFATSCQSWEKTMACSEVDELGVQLSTKWGKYKQMGNKGRDSNVMPSLTNSVEGL